MFTKRAIIARLGAALFLAGVSPVFADSTCANLENKNPQSKLEFLQSQTARLDSRCVLYALDQLRAARYAPAIATLIRYLDYILPDEPARLGPAGEPITVRGLKWTLFPAANALAEIGRPAIPQLVDVIANADTSDLIRKNAAETVLAIYSHDMPEGIAVIVRASRASGDPMAALRLMDQARRLASTCGLSNRNECENATLMK